MTKAECNRHAVRKSPILSSHPLGKKGGEQFSKVRYMWLETTQVSHFKSPFFCSSNASFVLLRPVSTVRIKSRQASNIMKGLMMFDQENMVTW